MVKRSMQIQIGCLGNDFKDNSLHILAEIGELDSITSQLFFKAFIKAHATFPTKVRFKLNPFP